ncbi:DUF4911 domain-containing protein [Carboxydocella sp. JDF658]|uniref:DUF4911 domain-containing protein n=1 Tax=Carboxydocella sp. JDF658 TaxID=1926600 RepID=UPI0009CC2BA1|nr:DUF4911 domain-containing protein [Carboxydocella sp. JDF658]GAW31064.1 DUF4911 domain-containing protein [Carboxydocella sp. JDF658]
MAKRYRGQGGVSTVRPGGHPEEVFLKIKIAPGSIRYLKNILEGYEHLAFMVPLNGREGIVALHTTSSLKNNLIAVLENLPFPVVFLYD